MEPGEVGQLLADLHLGVQAPFLGHVADAAAGVGVEGGAPPGHRAGVGGEHAHDDAHGGGLPRAVGADEADELIVSHGQGEGVEGLDAPESFGQMTDFQHEISGALGGCPLAEVIRHLRPRRDYTSPTKPETIHQ
mgnify:CR=1 FL=1